ncbi:methylenetetrahydrofolate reductase [NAD(P)H] [Algimonas porphyrae]|uniref:Methylenetetrahydrofolate reductase n=1 Tax=Algimonas porphyrae TaxID=1128113 RepID=A0ABQ5V0S4_9PROT|nr:methylenetetrahydrofolate reductase [NAD(P)H] [Algimonas porphyrae]GLQ19837.1 methylenetetrahydrofolate reductase [Algimonas porphyrae]
MSASMPGRDPNAPVGAIARTSSELSAPRSQTGVSVSFEFFPPKTSVAEDRLWDAIQKLEPLEPDFVSVTYGAGGSTRERTHRTVARMAQETRFAPAAHLTCVDASRAEIDAIAQDYWDAGVRHIVALRGDSPSGIGAAYQPHPEGYAYAADLVEGVKRIGDFEVSVAAYPELHPESADWSAEIDNLKRKIDAGATRAITQFFFSPDVFWRFQDRVLDAGINIPIVPGLMLQPNVKGLQRMSALCGVAVPNWYVELFEGLENDPLTRDMLTASLMSELTAELYARGVRHYHLYTLNRAEIASAVARVLGLHRRPHAV